MIDQKTVEKLKLWRQELHQHPELSGQEKGTARKILSFFEPLQPDGFLTRLGGEGLAIIFKGREHGPTTLIRCELDGLPIREDNYFSYRSEVEGHSHSCGHDGHMTIVCGVGLALAKQRPKKGRVVLLFQPAEETGEGAIKVLADQRFDQLQPDYAFALHNLPGFEINTILLKSGNFTAASHGMEIQLKGRTSHAAFPEQGNSPAPALAEIILALQQLPQRFTGFSLVTVVNAQLGELSFGTTPGDAVIRATLRSFDDLLMNELSDAAEDLVKEAATNHQLDFTISYREGFSCTVNHPEASDKVSSAASQLGYTIENPIQPFRWSEDFGQFSKTTKATLFGVGAGVDHPQLHESVYDFPDELIATGVQMFMAILNQTN